MFPKEGKDYVTKTYARKDDFCLQIIIIIIIIIIVFLTPRLQLVNIPLTWDMICNQQD